MSSLTLPPRTGAVAGLVGGGIIFCLGLPAAFAPGIVGDAWLATSAVAAFILVVALLGLRTSTSAVPGCRTALAIAAAGMALFGLAHLYSLTGDERAFVAFSIFMVTSSLSTAVAGVLLIRARLWIGAMRFVPLLCGVWPIATIPAGAAAGDLQHFLAIAGWGLCWIGLGAALRMEAGRHSKPAPVTSASV